MPKKTLFLILILALVTLGLVVLALKSTHPSSETNQTTSPTPITTAQLYFEPANLIVSNPRVPQEARIMINSGNTPVSGAQIELQYDPTVLSKVAFIPASSSAFFNYPTDTTILTNTTDPIKGLISYTISIMPNTTPRNGSGLIGTVVFTPIVGSNQNQTTIAFSPNSVVTSLQQKQSILKTASPLQITFPQQQTLINPSKATTSSGMFR